MTIYPLKKNLLGKPLNYIGAFIVTDKQTVAAMGDRKYLATLKLPKSVVFIDPSTGRRTFTSTAQALL